VPAITANNASGRPVQYDSTKRAVGAEDTYVNLAMEASYEGVIATEARGGDSLAPLETPVGPNAASEDDEPTEPGIITAERCNVEYGMEESCHAERSDDEPWVFTTGALVYT
jgi:hypothetical protein